jgi:hypothetical protein
VAERVSSAAAGRLVIRVQRSLATVVRDVPAHPASVGKDEVVIITGCLQPFPLPVARVRTWQALSASVAGVHRLLLGKRVG